LLAVHRAGGLARAGEGEAVVAAAAQQVLGSAGGGDAEGVVAGAALERAVTREGQGDGRAVVVSRGGTQGPGTGDGLAGEGAAAGEGVDAAEVAGDVGVGAPVAGFGGEVVRAGQGNVATDV